MHGFHIATNWKKSCWNSGTLQVWPYARSLRAEMLQKSLRGLTPTTFWLTPEALTATLLLKMKRGVLDVAQLSNVFKHPMLCRLNPNTKWGSKPSNLRLFPIFQNIRIPPKNSWFIRTPFIPSISICIYNIYLCILITNHFLWFQVLPEKIQIKPPNRTPIILPQKVRLHR